MKYFKRKWTEKRGDQFNDWGFSTFFFETDETGFPLRQIEKYDNGVILKYSKNNTEDKYGGLGDQELDLEEFNEFEISKTDFENEWESNSRNFITSEVIGTLFQNDQFDDWWESEPIEIPFFDHKKLKITFMDLILENDSRFIDEADKALKLFLEKKTNDRLKLSELAYQNCMEFLNAIGYDEADQPLWDIKEKNKIWNFIYAQDIYVTRRHRRDEDIYVNVTCECEWEQEHGLQLVFRQGKELTRISDQDGHLTEADAYDKLDEEDKLLSQFENKEKSQLQIIPENNDKASGKLENSSNNKSKSWWKKLWS
ncbi:hypothetical protein [Winogradskyella sp. 3972H.M.0a.05]|uniref:DUF6985 domain-containing protein n=1 Tax=Winogradskyella sp. 3972H.M.0a.05 TaxID=2950277 RepID=UPI0033917F77